MSYQERLKEIRKQSDTHKEINNSKKKYTMDELELSLFDRDSDVIKPFTSISKDDEISSNDLFIATLPNNIVLADGTTLEKGQYIGNSMGKLSDLEDMEDSGISSKTLYENGHRINLLAVVNNPKAVYTQKDLVVDIKDGVEVRDVTTKSSSVISKQKIDYISLVDESYFDNLIDDVLKDYNNLSNPNTLLKRYIKNKEMLGEGKKMIYCSLLDKEVLVVGGKDE
ncbi:hypothetical protein TwortDSMZ_170 [Staphylococcus phage Twort]|uniref:Uncharacterized protein n=2 Tax=Staphylococcus phage Twort (strain DSM 17442 / HER 48) TaxID=2908167 RepID=A0A6H0X5H0_BPTWO|nr:hypothetical protein TwortORF054 [Staphylococcus phage Twort]AAX92349.1 ORF054 [Staphylococcus phage Twort]QIW89168.1 hypothetical protein TwortDSMZ_170 [Staphylococcus phage Twort]